MNEVMRGRVKCHSYRNGRGNKIVIKKVRRVKTCVLCRKSLLPPNKLPNGASVHELQIDFRISLPSTFRKSNKSTVMCEPSIRFTHIAAEGDNS